MNAADIALQIDEINLMITQRNPAAITHAEELHDLAIQSKDVYAIARSKMTLASAYANLKGDFYRGIDILHDALELVEPTQDAFLLGTIYKRLGHFAHYKSMYVEAFNYYNHAVEYLERIAAHDARADINLAGAYHNIGMLHKLNDFAEYDTDYCYKALTIFERHSDKNGMADCYTLLAAIWSQQGKYEESLDLFLKALQLWEDTGNQEGIARSLNNIGTVYSELGDFDKAHTYHLRSLQIREQLQNPYLIAMAKLHIAASYRQFSKWDEAVKSYNEAEAYFTEVGYKSELNTIYKDLSDVYASMGNYKSAYEYMLRHSEMKSEIFGFDKASALTNARAAFDLEKKEKEAAILRLKNKEIEAYSKQLEVTNNELKQFAYIASHDLKEPVRTMSNYVQLLRKKMDAKLTGDEREFMEMIEVNARRMFDLVRDLMNYTKINEQDAVSTVSLHDTVKSVADELAIYMIERNALVHIDSLPEVTAVASHMKDLFKNLIQNAIKYNRSDQPEVTISAHLHAEGVYITITDNGIGIPDEYRENLFQLFKRLHSRNEFEGTGIGLAICKKIVDRYQGKIWVTQSPLGEGSVFHILLPTIAL
jgi:signal transduction histidine kinase